VEAISPGVAGALIYPATLTLMLLLPLRRGSTPPQGHIIIFCNPTGESVIRLAIPSLVVFLKVVSRFPVLSSCSTSGPVFSDIAAVRRLGPSLYFCLAVAVSGLGSLCHCRSPRLSTISS
jgi:hypothetical protein